MILILSPLHKENRYKTKDTVGENIIATTIAPCKDITLNPL